MEKEMEIRGLKVLEINKTKLTVMGREPAVRPQRGRYHVGFATKELEQTQYGVRAVKGGATRAQKSKKSWSKLNTYGVKVV